MACMLKKAQGRASFSMCLAAWQCRPQKREHVSQREPVTSCGVISCREKVITQASYPCGRSVGLCEAELAPRPLLFCPCSCATYPQHSGGRLPSIGSQSSRQVLRTGARRPPTPSGRTASSQDRAWGPSRLCAPQA